MLLCVHAPPHVCRTCAVVAGQNPVLLASCLSRLTNRVRQRTNKFLYQNCAGVSLSQIKRLGKFPPQAGALAHFRTVGLLSIILPHPRDAADFPWSHPPPVEVYGSSRCCTGHYTLLGPKRTNHIPKTDYFLNNPNPCASVHFGWGRKEASIFLLHNESCYTLHGWSPSFLLSKTEESKVFPFEDLTFKQRPWSLRDTQAAS